MFRIWLLNRNSKMFDQLYDCLVLPTDSIQTSPVVPLKYPAILYPSTLRLTYAALQGELCELWMSALSPLSCGSPASLLPAQDTVGLL